MSKRFPGSLTALFLCNLTLQAQVPKPMLEGPPEGKAPQTPASARPLVKKWTMIDLEGLLGAGLEGARHYEKGRTYVRQATCLTCHRFNGEGSKAGPDLTTSATRHGPSELLAHILEPDREISESYGQQEVTLKDGSMFSGRIVKDTADKVTFQLKMKDPKALRPVERKLIKSMVPFRTSMMPSGLLDTFHETEILDLLAYLLSKGDRNDPMFK